MTTRIELTWGDAEIVVTGEYIRAERQFFDPRIGIGSPGYPSEFRIEAIEQNGRDVTEEYRRWRVIPELETLALEQVESD